MLRDKINHHIYLWYPLVYFYLISLLSILRHCQVLLVELYTVLLFTDCENTTHKRQTYSALYIDLVVQSTII